MSNGKSTDNKAGNLSNQLESEKRRQVMRGAAAGGGISMLAGAGRKWYTPVVENVMLPAHAVMTGNDTSPLLSVSDPCDITVTQDGAYRVQVSGNLLGPADLIGGVTGSVNVQAIGCSSEIIDEETVPVTTAGDGSYIMLPNVWLFLGDPGAGEYITDIVATVTFPDAAPASCPADVKTCT